MIEVVGALATLASVAFAVWAYTRNYRLSLRLAATSGERFLAAVASSGRQSDIATMPTVEVRIVNHGRDVRVEKVGWVDPDTQGRADHIPLGPQEPVLVAGRDGEVISLPAADLADRDDKEPVTFWVRLTTGERLYAPGVRRSQPVVRGPQKPVRLLRRHPRRSLLSRWGRPRG